jgi:hypothetical protein
METPARVVTVSPESFGAMNRYMDAYRVANVVTKFGETIKAIGAILGTLVVVISVVVALQRDDMHRSMGILGVVIGGIAGLLIYILGTLIAAQGQILLASLDVAVCTSPFLSDEQRAKVMSLAKTEKIRYQMESVNP